MSDLELWGRSSSHFTRTVRILALELGVSHAFRPVLDITSTEAANYAGNPALKVPVLVTVDGPLFGTENICREFKRRSNRGSSVVLRGDTPARLVANAEELTLHAMSAEVSLIMAKMAQDERVAPPKARIGLDNSLRYLDENLGAVMQTLPSDRALSFLEAALFCLVTHLSFRQVLDVRGYARLGAFCARFSERESARLTEYKFDAL